MGRALLDKLHAANKRAAINEALSGNVDDDDVAFLRDHVGELIVDDLLAFLRSGRASEDIGIEPFIEKLTDVIASGAEHVAVPVLQLSDKVNVRDWAHLTRSLRGRIRDPIWYFFVDRVRGGEIFNELNVPPAGFPSLDFLCYAATSRPPPLVIPLLDTPDNDVLARPYAFTCPMAELLRLHEVLPRHFPREDMERSIAGRATSKGDRWPRTLPTWMAPYVIQRLRVCEDEEAQDLYAWLVEHPSPDVACDFFELAFERFRLSPLTQVWHPIVGRHLASGKDWKRRGIQVLAFCANYNRGFPPRLLTASLEAAHADDGVAADTHRKSILKAVHDETAKLFVARAELALRTQDWETARKTLDALRCLDPGRFIRGRIHYMQKIEPMPGDVRALLDVCEELAGIGGRNPSTEAIEEAFHRAFIALYGGLP